MNASQIVEEEQYKMVVIRDPLQKAEIYKGNNFYFVTIASSREFVVIQN
ncbi:hypothetical protein ACQCVP_11460 [Rossellomorea vietnamensis]